MEDPVRNNDFTPQAYSSFLFNHLLQAQFYQVDSGGVAVSFNINNITFNNVNVTNNRDYTFVNGHNNKICVNKPGSIYIDGLKDEESMPPKVEDDLPSSLFSSPMAIKLNTSSDNTNMVAEHEEEPEIIDLTIPKETTPIPISIPIPIPTRLPTPPPSSPTCTRKNTPPSPKSTSYPYDNIPNQYRSSLFLQLLTKQANSPKQIQDTPVHPITPNPQSNIYPAIDLLDFFGERELVRNNKKKLEPLLYGRRCNMDALRQCTKQFLPVELRPMVWQLLFNYLPEERSPRECVLLEKQRRFRDMLSVINVKNHQELVNQIDMDVLRTMPEGYEDVFGHALVRESLSRVLLVWAVQHPRTGYFQGLNDLASPFFASFLTHAGAFQVGKPQFFDDCDPEDAAGARRSDPTAFGEGLLQRVEADVYWCLCCMLDNLEYLNAGSKCGVHAEAMMAQLEALIKRIDVPLDSHMRKQNVEYVHFSFPWMLCLFVRELSLDLLMVLWDFYASYEDGLSAGFSVMHVYICTAFLQKFRVQILSMEFIDLLKLLHHPPTQSWTARDVYDLIDKAKDLYTRFPM